jgi:hypothetical protein
MPQLPIQLPASDLPAKIGQPATRALAQFGILRLEQLTAHTESEIQALHGVGPKAICILRQALASHGLSFRAEG